MSDLDKLIKNLNKLGKIVTASELDKPAPKKPAPAKTQTPAPAAPVRKQSSAEDDWDKQFEQFLNQKEKQEGHRIINPLKEEQGELQQAPSAQAKPAAPAPAASAKPSSPKDDWDRQFEQFMQQKQEDERKAQISKVTSLTVPEGYKNPYAEDERAKGIFREELKDALDTCLDRLGEVDIEFISQISGRDIAETVKGLKGLCYCDPERWVGRVFLQGLRHRGGVPFREYDKEAQHRQGGGEKLRRVLR